MPRVLFILQSAFSLWMLVDAVGRRGISRYWYWIILMPFGEFAYFLKFKIHDPEFAWLKKPFGSLLDKPLSIEQQRFVTEETPSQENKLRLAQALHDADQFQEAAELFVNVLERDETSVESLYGLGLSRIGLSDFDGAIDPLERLVGVEPSHREYDGWAKLARSYWELGRRDEAITTLGRLVKMSPRMPHRVAYAFYLAETERRDEAQSQLTTALQEYEHSPKYLKKTHRAFAKRAKEMLRQLSA